MGKFTICKRGENKGADQLRSYCEADQRLCLCYMDSTIPLHLHFLTIFYDCTAWFVSKPKLSVSHAQAHISLYSKGEIYQNDNMATKLNKSYHKTIDSDEREDFKPYESVRFAKYNHLSESTHIIVVGCIWGTCKISISLFD